MKSKTVMWLRNMSSSETTIHRDYSKDVYFWLMEIAPSPRSLSNVMGEEHFEYVAVVIAVA